MCKNLVRHRYELSTYFLLLLSAIPGGGVMKYFITPPLVYYCLLEYVFQSEQKVAHEIEVTNLDLVTSKC